MGCLEGSGVPVLYIGARFLKVNPYSTFSKTVSTVRHLTGVCLYPSSF